MEARILRLFAAMTGIPALTYVAIIYGMDALLALILLLLAQDCWMKSHIVRDLETRYENQEATRQHKESATR